MIQKIFVHNLKGGKKRHFHFENIAKSSRTKIPFYE